MFHGSFANNGKGKVLNVIEVTFLDRKFGTNWYQGYWKGVILM